MIVVNTTIAYNNVSGTSQGGGLANIRGTATLDNTIVAQNTDGTGSGAPADDITGAGSESGSDNLIGTYASNGLTNGSNGNQLGVAKPLLGAAGQLRWPDPDNRALCPAAPPSMLAVWPWPSTPSRGCP